MPHELKTYHVRVVRKQSWTYEDIQAQNAEEAKTLADKLATCEAAHDDWAYETLAREVIKPNAT